MSDPKAVLAEYGMDVRDAAAEEFGGGMLNHDSSPTLTNCTFIECCQVVPPNSFIDKGGNDYESWCDECRANVDCVGEVDAADLGLLLSAWNTTEAQPVRHRW
jgi:hypothetical protein